jgi:hypothetical protein
VLLLGLLVAPSLGLLAGVSVYLGARAVFQGGSYVPDSPWQSAGGLVGLTVTALVSVIVVRRYRIGPPWRTLLVIGSLAAIPGLVFLLAGVTLMPALGIVIVALALLITAIWASQARAASDR